MENSTNLNIIEKNKIDINNINTITNFGTDIINKINIDDNKLNILKKTSNTDVNNLISDILNKVDDIDFNALQSNSLLNRIFKKMHLKKFTQKFNTIKDSIDDVQKKLEEGLQNCNTDNNIIDATYNNNVVIVPEIDKLIEYGKQEQYKLDKIDTSKFETYELQSYNAVKHQLAKKINALLNIRNILSQELVQLKIMEENNTDLVSKITEINQYVIPLWKHNLSTILILENQNQNAKLIKAISDTTNKMISLQSSLLYENSLAIANENERGIIDISTLKNSTDILYKTLTDINNIHKNAIKNQGVYEEELNQLKNKIKNIYSLFE